MKREKNGTKVGRKESERDKMRTEDSEVTGDRKWDGKSREPPRPPLLTVR